MRPLIITYVRHAVPGCCKGNAAGLEHISSKNEPLIGDVCLSSGRWICKESDMCPVQDIEVIIDWFSVVMWVAIKTSNLSVGGANQFSCRPESVDQGMCRAGTFCYKKMLNVLGEERVLGGRLWRSAWNYFPGSKGCVSQVVVSIVSRSLTLCAFCFIWNTRGLVLWIPGSWRSELAQQLALR